MKPHHLLLFYLTLIIVPLSAMAQKPVVDSVEVILHPQIHPPFHVGFEQIPQEFKRAILLSQVEIFNNLYAHRDYQNVVFSEGQYREFSGRSRSVFRLKRTRPEFVRRQFRELNLPLAPEMLNDVQRRLLIQVGGANVAMIMGFARASLPAESYAQNFKTQYQVIKRSLSVLRNISSHSSKPKDLLDMDPLDGPHVYADREMFTMNKVRQFVNSKKYRSGDRIVVIYGYKHWFKGPYDGLTVKRAASRAEFWGQQAEAATQEAFQLHLQKCIEDLGLDNENAMGE